MINTTIKITICDLVIYFGETPTGIGAKKLPAGMGSRGSGPRGDLTVGHVALQSAPLYRLRAIYEYEISKRLLGEIIFSNE